ncbi:MAG: aminopeptidase [Anaerolineae bacterium]|nr:aminopeptidase [Anaerolineae bacterium]
MYDPRFNKMASVLVNYSLQVKPGQRVYVWGSSPLASPLMLEVYREVLNAGGNAFLRADLLGAQEIFYGHASDAVLETVTPIDEVSVDPAYFDAYVRIGADANTRRLSNVDPAKVAKQQAAMRPVLNRRMERAAEGSYNWVVARMPTEAYAMDAEMSLAEYTEFVFSACLLNQPDPVSAWQAVGQNQQRFVDFLKGKRELVVRGSHVDLTMRIDARIFRNSCGRRNFPDGEIFTAPVEDSVNGWIRYSYPAIYNGREVNGIELKFEQGKVVHASASKNQDFLLQMLDSDAGARYLGEFAIGTNYGITQFSRDTLFDEKIGGTIHLAVGAGYPDTGSKNHSAIHWDMITAMHDGSIFADGIEFYRNGQFLI